MAQTIDQIEDHIDRTRERMGSDFRELENKVSAATDWHTHYQRSPAMFLGAAALGGVVLAAALNGKRKRRGPAIERHERQERHEPRALVPERVKTQTSQLVSNFTSALIGLGAAKAMSYIEAMAPGFDDEYRRAAQEFR